MEFVLSRMGRGDALPNICRAMMALKLPATDIDCVSVLRLMILAERPDDHSRSHPRHSPLRVRPRNTCAPTSRLSSTTTIGLTITGPDACRQRPHVDHTRAKHAPTLNVCREGRVA